MIDKRAQLFVEGMQEGSDSYVPCPYTRVGQDCAGHWANVYFVAPAEPPYVTGNTYTSLREFGGDEHPAQLWLCTVHETCSDETCQYDACTHRYWICRHCHAKLLAKLAAMPDHIIQEAVSFIPT